MSASTSENSPNIENNQIKIAQEVNSDYIGYPPWKENLNE